MISETVLVALVGAGSAVAGGVVTALATLLTGKRQNDVKSSELLLQAQLELSDQIAYSQRLWQWNRELVDAIWSRKGPPPPKAPPDLFERRKE